MKSLKDRARGLLEAIHIRYESKTRRFFTIHERPMYESAIDVSSKNPLTKIESDMPVGGTAIIIQGPIWTERDFTYETIRLYKKNFPKCSVIVSTWKDEPAEALEKIRSVATELILNEKPAYAGTGNINYQIVTSREGVFQAKKLGAKWAFKTRTDQRMYATNVLPFFISLVEAFPLKAGLPAQKKRLIGTSLNTFKYRPYNVSDTFLFGNIDDMILYWDCPFDDRKPDLSAMKKTTRGWLDFRLCEVYLVTNFLECIGRKRPDYTLADSWRVYGEHFCIVDQQDIDLYWAKYERRREYRRLRYAGVYMDEELDFRNWLLMYADAYDKKNIPEAYLDIEFATKIK